MTRPTNDRLVAITAGFWLLLGVLWMRCVWLQCIQAGTYVHRGQAQHHVARRLSSPRGLVLDRHGRVLAMSAQAPSVYANARQVVDPGHTARRLAPVLGRDPAWVTERLARDKAFVWLARHVDQKMIRQLTAFRREGIGIVEEPTRLYPQAGLASQLLGSVDIDQRGLEGLELDFDGILRGRPGWESTIRDAKGDVLLGPWTTHLDPQPGFELVLTIDSVVQGVAEEALAWGMDTFHAKGGSVIVLDPQTGEVLALANQPGYDPNRSGQASAEARRNRAITDVMEPGSVFKIVAAAALLEEGLIDLDEKIFCENGEFRTAGRHILHDHHAFGWLPFQEVISRSSNIGTAKAAQRLTPEVLARYIRAFGFGRKTGIDLPGEVRGIVSSPSRWSKLSPYMIPIGHEIAVTPMQLAVMTAAIANGGWKVQPYVVARIQGHDGRTVRTARPAAPTRILHPETVVKLDTILSLVVDSGTGQLANVQGLTVAGKTGTAQKIEPNGRYSHSRFVASFVGYGPVPDPQSRSTSAGASRFAIVVTMDEPRPVYYGGKVSARIFQRVVERLVGYWELNRSTPAYDVAQLS